MVPFHGGAFLPIEQRYTSPIYRRLRRIDQAEWLSLREAAELVAVVRLVGFKAARTLFRWNGHRTRQAERLLSHGPVLEASEAYHEANLRALSAEDGFFAFRALDEHGWRGVPPDIVMRAIAAKRKDGATLREVADWLGVNYHRLQQWVHPRDRGRVAEQAKAVAALAMP